MKKVISFLIFGLLIILLNGCLSSGDKVGNNDPKMVVSKPFGVMTLETIKENYLDKKYLFIENDTEFSAYENINLNNVYTVTDVIMKTIDDETVNYILVFESDGNIREQEYGHLFKNVQNINFFEYKYIITGDTISIYNEEIEMQFDRRNKDSIEKQKLLYRAYYPLEAFMVTYEKFKMNGSSEYVPPNNHNVNKLMALLVNPMAASSFGQFSRNEDVRTSRGLLRVVDLQHTGSTYMFLVAVNDYNVQKPFYIITNRMLNLMNLDYPDTVFEELWLKYIGNENYYSNGISRETFVFQMNTNN
jgi:hypothetical protein